MRIKSFITSLILFITYSVSFAFNGSFLLIGGGAEKDYPNSWSTAAYSWAVEQSENKKVAIISFSESSDWMPDYFTNSCGAVGAKNFLINSIDIADNQATYDSLTQYDVIFLKGGDQFNYYSTYKSTKTQEAIEYTYENGGVICGTSAGLAILSGVVFTAENGSVDADEAIENPMRDDITLANDMFQFFPGFIFDSHFTIRARFGRLLAFMANWKMNNNETLTGIGVDEMTALAVSKEGLGTVYGIGTANIYKTKSENTFSLSGSKLIADTVNVTQLLQGCTYNFNTHEILGFQEQSTPTISEETGNYTIFASGTNNINFNGEMLSSFVNDVGFSTDEILLISATNSSLATKYKDELISEGASSVDIIAVEANNADDPEIKIKIADAKKILFVDNAWDDISGFLLGGQAGELLNSKIRENDAIVGFVGDNSRFAGRVVVQNYLVSGAAYYGELEFDDGLGLLNTSVIIPNTYFGSDFYENTASAIPYTLVTENLTYGIWLSTGNYIKYSPIDNQTYINAFGDVPVMVLKNTGTNSGVSSQTASGSTSNEYPQYAGFEKMQLALIDETTLYKTGNSVTIDVVDVINNPKINIWQSTDNLLISGDGDYYVQIVDLSGKVLRSRQFRNYISIQSRDLISGLYLVQIREVNSNLITTKKVIF